jgi:hypothetical protein
MANVAIKAAFQNLRSQIPGIAESTTWDRSDETEHHDERPSKSILRIAVQGPVVRRLLALAWRFHRQWKREEGVHHSGCR